MKTQRDTIAEVVRELVEELRLLGVNASVRPGNDRDILVDGQPLYVTHADNAKRVEPSKLNPAFIDNKGFGLPCWVSFVKPYPCRASTRATIIVERGNKLFRECEHRAQVAEAAAYIKSQL